MKSYTFTGRRPSDDKDTVLYTGQCVSLEEAGEVFTDFLLTLKGASDAELQAVEALHYSITFVNPNPNQPAAIAAPSGVRHAYLARNLRQVR